MKKTFMGSGCVFLVLIFILSWSGVSTANTFDVSMTHEAENSIARALEFLAGEQAEDGSWGHYPGITGLVLNAFMRAPESNRQIYQDQIRRGYEYLLTNVQQDGGFIYYPGVSKAGATTSYGGMTYAGLKSFIHAGLLPEDDRVQAAYRWIRNNFTVEENPCWECGGCFTITM
jgi:squalene cyclase